MITGLGAALVGFGGSAVSNILGEASSRRQRNWQEKMYRQQRDDALMQWHRENAYNDPSAQMARLKNAGINPDMAYSSGQVQNLASHSSIPSAGSYQPYFPSVDLTSALSMAQQLKNMQAEEDKTRAETESIKETTKSTMTFNEYYDAILKGSLELNDVNISNTKQLTKSEAEKLYPTINKLNAETESINQAISESKSRTALYDAQKIGQEIDNAWKNSMYSAQVRDLSTRANLSSAQTKELLEGLFYKVGILKSDYSRQSTLTQQQMAVLDNIVLQNGRLKIDINNAPDEHELNVLTSLVGAASTVLGNLKPSGGSPITINVPGNKRK